MIAGAFVIFFSDLWCVPLLNNVEGYFPSYDFSFVISIHSLLTVTNIFLQLSNCLIFLM